MVSFCLYVAVIVCVAQGQELKEHNATETSIFFTPLNQTWFSEWRDRFVRRLDAEMWEASDPTVADRVEIQAVLRPILLPRSMLATLISVTGRTEYTVPALRAIYSFRILSDLGLLDTAEEQVDSDYQRIVSLEHPRLLSAQWLVMTFQLALISNPAALSTLRLISEEHRVAFSKLTEYVGRIGAVEGARWFNVFLGLSRTRAILPSFNSLVSPLSSK